MHKYKLFGFLVFLALSGSFLFLDNHLSPVFPRKNISSIDEKSTTPIDYNYIPYGSYYHYYFSAIYSDIISWSFVADTTSVGITVLGMDNTNYQYFVNNLTYTFYELSSGIYYSDSGNWLIPYDDANWHVIFWNADSSMLGSWVTTTLQVIADTQSPSIVISNPTNNAYLKSSVTISATATDNTGVAFCQAAIDTSAWIDDTTSPYEWSWDTLVSTDGWHTIYARAYDFAGNYVTTSIQVYVDNGIPTITILSPSNGATLSGSVLIKVQAADSGSGIQRCSVIAQPGGSWTDINTAPYEWSWDTPSWANGTYTVYARAYDYAGNYAETSITVTLSNGIADLTNPTISILSPSDQQNINSGLTAITAEALDNIGVVRCELWINSQLISIDTSAPWSWSYNFLENQDYTITIKAFDAAGNFAMDSHAIHVGSSSNITSSSTGNTESDSDITFSPGFTNEFTILCLGVLGIVINQKKRHMK